MLLQKVFFLRGSLLDRVALFDWVSGRELQACPARLDP